MDSELIQLKGVTKSFGKNTVLSNIDLTIAENEITGIIGASGEGKTTILKLLIGFYKPTHGEIMYLRRNIADETKDIEKNFGFATEDGSFYENLSVKENVFHFGRLQKMKGDAIKARFEEIIPLVGLSKAVDTLAKNLSIGMKKRLDLACSIVHNPKVLIMDEPTADLDPLLRKNLLELIKEINKQGTTVVMTTQLLGEADKICDKVAILYNEKIIEEDRPSRIKSKYKSSDMDGVFEKIFSRKARKTYLESVVKKSEMEEDEKKRLKEIEKEIEKKKKKLEEQKERIAERREEEMKKEEEKRMKEEAEEKKKEDEREAEERERKEREEREKEKAEEVKENDESA